MAKLTFLGTGTSQGVPVISCHCRVCLSPDERDKRLRTSALIETGRETILIDAGPDFRQQMLRAGVERLDGILLTHEHKDHISVPEIDLHTIRPDEPFSIGQTRIVPIRGIHYKLPVLGFRIGPLAYLTDMNRIDEREIDKIRGVDTLVINALRKEPHLSHFTLDDALRISRAVSSNVTYLTHVSHQMGRHAEEQAALPEGVYFAYDGLTVEIPE